MVNTTMVEVRTIMVGENTLSILNIISTINIIIVVAGILAEATTAEEGTTIVASIGVMEDMVSG